MITTSHLSEWLLSVSPQVLVRMWRKGNPSGTVGGNADRCSDNKNSMENPQKIKNGTSSWPSDSTSGYISKKSKTLIWKDNMHPMFTTALFTITKIRKQHKCPLIEKWIKKLHIHTIKYYSAIKKELYFTICNSMNGLRGYYAKWNKSEKDFNTYRWCNKKFFCSLWGKKNWI